VSAGITAGNNTAPATTNSKGNFVFFMMGLTKPGQNPEIDLSHFTPEE
jgi:hypothetical protein